MNETITYIQKSLEPLYLPEEIRSLTGWILEKTCNLSRHQQILHKDKQLSNMEKQFVQTIVERLRNSEPIQYIFGETEFYGLPFAVNPAVLIPRSETEELVHLIIKDMNVFSNQTYPVILDIGAGSGCIAVTLAKNLPETKVYALDISDDALQLAKRNAQRNGVIIHFFQADILSYPPIEGVGGGHCPYSLPQFDLIVSNPPYVKESEKTVMKSNVLEYEPYEALFVPDEDPILFYRRIAEFGLEKLIVNGLLYFEINASHREMICLMLSQKGFHDIEYYHDLSGRERFIKARR